MSMGWVLTWQCILTHWYIHWYELCQTFRNIFSGSKWEKHIFLHFKAIIFNLSVFKCIFSFRFSNRMLLHLTIYFQSYFVLPNVYFSSEENMILVHFYCTDSTPSNVQINTFFFEYLFCRSSLIISFSTWLYDFGHFRDFPSLIVRSSPRTGKIRLRAWLMGHWDYICYPIFCFNSSSHFRCSDSDVISRKTWWNLCFLFLK